VPRHQNIGRDYNVTGAIKSLEGNLKFKYLGTTITDQNYIHEEILRRLNSGDVCYN
jgi:hypothetical protein